MLRIIGMVLSQHYFIEIENRKSGVPGVMSLGRRLSLWWCPLDPESQAAAVSDASHHTDVSGNTSSWKNSFCPDTYTHVNMYVFNLDILSVTTKSKKKLRSSPNVHQLFRWVLPWHGALWRPRVRWWSCRVGRLWPPPLHGHYIQSWVGNTNPATTQ